MGPKYVHPLHNIYSNNNKLMNNEALINKNVANIEALINKNVWHTPIIQP